MDTRLLEKRSKQIGMPTIVAREFSQFSVCAEELNISRAAERLGISQPSLSKSLQNLERRLDKKLFVRRAQGLSLTDYGRSLAETVARMQDLWQSSLAVSLSGQVEDLFGRVRIGCHNSVAMSVFPRLLPRLLEKYPQLDIDASFATSLEVTQKVARLELDLGFVINPVKNPDLIARRLSVAYVGIWKQKNHSESRALLFHPDMYQVPKLVAGSPELRKVPIPDYEVIARSVANSDCLGILPNDVAHRHGLEMVGEKLFETSLNLILHTQRFGAEVRAKLIQEACQALQV